MILTDEEIKLIDNYIINNFDEFNEAVFYTTISKIFPTWRSEQLYNQNSFVKYLETFLEEK